MVELEDSVLRESHGKSSSFDTFTSEIAAGSSRLGNLGGLSTFLAKDLRTKSTLG